MWNKVLAAAVIAFGTALTAALGIDIYEHHQVSKKIGIGVKELKDATVKDIRDGMIQSAVDKAAEDGVNRYLQNIGRQIRDQAERELSGAAKKAVEEEAGLLKGKVAEKVTEEVSKIDISDMKKSVREKAEERILEKFDDDLDDLLEKYNDSLSNIQRIYGGIADAISKGQERDKSIKFSLG